MFKIELENGFLPPGIQFSFTNQTLLSMNELNKCERFQLLRIKPEDMSKFKQLFYEYLDIESKIKNPEIINSMMIKNTKELKINMDWNYAIGLYQFTLCDLVPDIIFNNIPYHKQKWDISFYDINNKTDKYRDRDVRSSGRILWYKYIENTKNLEGKIIQGVIKDFDVSKLEKPEINIDDLDMDDF